jgi:hypothetical protein
MQTGFPFTVNLRGDPTNVGAGTGGIFVRPNAVAGTTADLDSSARSTGRWFNTGAFVNPTAGTFGNVGRNTVTGPSLTNFDVVLQKNISVSERVKLQIRAEGFNVANHPNYSIVGRIIGDPTYGVVQSQLDPRQLQFGIKVVF